MPTFKFFSAEQLSEHLKETPNPIAADEDQSKSKVRSFALLAPNEGYNVQQYCPRSAETLCLDGDETCIMAL